jgi:hypothetical protein
MATPKVLGTPVLLLSTAQVPPPAEQGLLFLPPSFILLPAAGAVHGLPLMLVLLRNLAVPLQLLYMPVRCCQRSWQSTPWPRWFWTTKESFLMAYNSFSFLAMTELHAAIS